MSQYPERHTGHFLHQISYHYRERLVGLFVLAAFVLFLLFVLIGIQNQHLFENRVTYYLELDSSEGIGLGVTVTALGAEIGRVTRLSLTKDLKIRVAVEVYESQREWVRIGAKAVVNRLTNIGSALIEIRPDSISAPVLPDGATIPVEETPSLNDMLLALASLIQSAERNRLLGKFEAILPKLEQTLTNVHEIIAQIATGHGTVGAAVFDRQVEDELKIVVKSGAHILTQAEGIIDEANRRMEQLAPLLNDTALIAKNLSDASQDLPKLLADIRQTMTLTRTALTLINEELKDLPGIALETRRTLNRADKLLHSAQQTWPLSSHTVPADKNHLIPIQTSHD